VADCRARSAGGAPHERRRRRARYLIARAAADLVAQRIKAGGTDGADRLADQVLTGTLAPEDAARRLLEG
jgi:LAO/AO transport system kinase